MTTDPIGCHLPTMVLTVRARKHEAFFSRAIAMQYRTADVFDEFLPGRYRCGRNLDFSHDFQYLLNLVQK